MNQILVSEKIYVTPELKRKKKFYKFDFFLSVFLVCILFSCYIYAEYDRSKSEAVSQQILKDFEMQLAEIDDSTVTEEDNDIILVILNAEPEEDNTIIEIPKETKTENKVETKKSVASDGKEYYNLGQISIPKININYPILSTYSDALLKIAPCKFHGPNLHETGNFCIVAHNYRNSKFFSKVPTLENGDLIYITDAEGKQVTYQVYSKYTVDPEDRACTSQHTNGRTEITLITCTNDNKERWIIKAFAK